MNAATLFNLNKIDSDCKKISKCSFVALITLLISSLCFGEGIDAPKREKKYMNINSKLDELIDINKINRGQALNYVMSNKITQQNNNVIVYIRPKGNDSKNINIDLFEQYGISYRKSRKSVTAEVPINYLEKVVKVLKGVQYIDLVQPAIPQEFTSQGRALMNASNFNNLGYEGANVKVAVIDSEFKYYSSAMAAGELPGSTVTKNYTSETFGTESGCHGTACAEIIHDLAPEALIYLIKCFSLTDYENAIDYCVENGIRVISHSAGWLNVNFIDGTGPYVDWVKEAVDQGILFVNSAGNYAHGNWTGLANDVDNNKWIEFSSSGYEVLEINNPGVGNEFSIYLTWDKFPLTSEDYDLYLYDKNSNQIAKSNTVQINDNPSESISYTPKTGDTSTYYVSVLKYKVTQDCQIRVLIHDTDITNSNDQVHAGSISTPADATEALAVGAIYHANYITGPQESFSSEGPTHDGRIKPDIAAPDGINTYAYSPGSFYGTSAAAPHVAGIACILKGMMPQISVTQLREYLENNAIDMGAQGKDNIYGYGRLRIPETIIDTTPPKASIIISPVSSLKTGQFDIALTIDDANYIVGTPTVTYALSDGAIKTVTLSGSNKNWNGTSYIESYYPDGVATFSFSAVDLQNNTGTEITSGKSFEIDKTIKAQDGGTISSLDGTKIVIPAGILSSDANFSIITHDNTNPLISSANQYLRNYRALTLPEVYREFVMNSPTGQNITMSGNVAIYIPYNDTNSDGILDGSTIKADQLKIAYLNETTKEWELMSNSSVLQSEKLVTGQINHLSYFTLLPVTSYSDLAKVYAYPNPLKLSVNKTIKVVNLPSLDLHIDIYNIAGELVKTLDSNQGIEDFLGGKIGTWDTKNENNEFVASGIYILVIQTANTTEIIKVAVIK